MYISNIRKLLQIFYHTLMQKWIKTEKTGEESKQWELTFRRKTQACIITN